MSQKTVLHPTFSTTFAVDIHERAGTITSSSSSRFKESIDKNKAEVHEVVAIYYSALVN